VLSPGLGKSVRPLGEAEYLAVLLLVTLSGTAAHLLIVMAFSLANAATLMSFVYVQIGFAGVMSWLVFHHTPDFLS
jgi:drug/metabolite transporter (DMT)-like permease